MKRYINRRLFAVLCLGILLAGCSDSASSPENTPAPQETAITEMESATRTEVLPAEKPAPAVKSQPSKSVSFPVMNAQELTENLKLWDKKLSSLETDFMQTTSYDGVEVSRSKGKLFYDRTLNRLRLDTLNTAGETEQTAITDKQEIVILDENNQHVTTLSWTDWQQGQPNQALFDFGNYTALVDRHTSSVKSQDGQTAVLALIPKEGEEYTLYLTLSKRDFFPEVITIESDLMITRADLKNTRKNQPLPADIFGGFNNK